MGRTLRALKDRARRCEKVKKKRPITWEIEGLEFCFEAGACIRKVIKEFAKLLREIAPLLELSEIIFKQVERRPLNATTSMTLFMPVPVIDGMPVKRWLEIRERAALDIDADTAEVVCAYRKYFDPYDIYPELPGQYGDCFNKWYARSPGSKIWVWFDDLPRTTQKALSKRIKQEQSREEKKEKVVEVFDLSQSD